MIDRDAPSYEAEIEALKLQLANARNALDSTFEPDAVERLLEGEEIESDYLTKHDFAHLELLNERDRLRIENEGLRKQLAHAEAVLKTWRDGNHTRRENPPAYADLGIRYGEIEHP
jgi:hypothetical protein